MRILLVPALAALLALSVPPVAIAAGNQGVIVVANDLPITSYDITQKINLLNVLGSNGTPDRKAVLKSLVDDVVKLAEADRMKVAPTPSEVDSQIDRLAKNMKMDRDSLFKKLKDRGVATEFFRRYIKAQMGFGRVLSIKNVKKKEATVSAAEVDAKMAEIKSRANAQISKIMADPRMKPITVYSLAQYDLPVENDDPGLLQARAADAMQVVKQFRGCKNLRGAASGVFNVKVGKMLEADGAKLPPPFKKALDKTGAGHAIGPVRGPKGLQVIAFCGVRKITPPKPKFDLPTRDQVENSLLNEKYASEEEVFLAEARKHVYIEYRDQSYAP